MTINNIVVPHAPTPGRLYWDSGSGLAVLDTDRGQRIYDLQGLACLITEGRKRGIPVANYEQAYQSLRAYGDRFKT